MRFLLDQDVDVEVARRLRSLGHEAWTAHEAGLSGAEDDDLAVYAHARAAVLVTHDREFSQRRRTWIVGQHIWLRCNEWDAADVLANALNDLLAILERKRDVYIALSVAGYQISF